MEGQQCRRRWGLVMVHLHRLATTGSQSGFSPLHCRVDTQYGACRGAAPIRDPSHEWVFGAGGRDYTDLVHLGELLIRAWWHRSIALYGILYQFVPKPSDP